MSRQPTSDLKEGWPDHPENDELANVGRELFAERPELPQIALDRIQIQVRQELSRVGRQRRLRTVLIAMVACAAIAAGVWAWKSTTGRQRATTPSPATTTPSTVRDAYDVAIPS